MNREQGVNWTSIVGVVAIGIVTVILAVLALNSVRGQVPNAGETPGYSPSARDDQQSEGAPSDPAEEGEDEVTPAPEPVLTVPALSRVLGVQDNDVAYRATSGACPEAGFTVETSGDGGVTWTVNGDGAATGLSSPKRILTGADGYVNVVAQNASNCAEVVVAQSYGYGDFWEAVAGGADLTWHLDPSNAAAAFVPQVGAVALPCEAARIASLSATAASVLCSDTRIATTSDSGANWTLSEAFPGAEALSATGDTYLVAQTGVADCAGTLVSRVNPGHAVESSACVGSAASVGATALAGTGSGVVWLWAGDAVLRSTDGGVNWG